MDLDLAHALGSVALPIAVQTVDLEAHRLERVHEERVADGLHVEIEDLADRVFGRAKPVRIVDVLRQVDPSEPRVLDVGAHVPLEGEVNLVV